MRKIVLALLALNVCSAAIAYQASVGTRVSEPRITNNGFQDFKVTSSDKTAMSPKYVSAMAMTSDQSGRPGENVHVKSWHNITLSNYTKKVQRYTYTYRLVCQSHSGTYSRDVDLQPNGTFSDSAQSFGVVQENEGTYRISSATQITGGESVFHDANAVLRIRK